MDDHLNLLYGAFVGYLLGSVMGAYWSSLWFGLANPWANGSSNPGATNIYRLAGWPPALLTLFWDAAKGALSVAIALYLSLDIIGQTLVAATAILGHMFPVFHNFKGGKGVATILGCGLILAPLTILTLAVIWALIAGWKRISSLASLGASVCAPLICWWLDPAYLLFFVLCAVFVAIRHRENITKLWEGKENSLL